jgi:alcohol dehydrogenase class IV
MAKEYTDFQRGIINRYYHNQKTISLQNLQELVTELFLADTDKKREKLWERVHKAMINLKIPDKIIEHIMSKKDIQVLAKNVAEWVAKSGRK